MRPCGAITHLRRPLATLPVLLMLAAPATAAAGEAPAGATSCVVLEPRTSFLASLHGALRTAAQAGNTDIHASPGLGRAILMYQRLEGTFPLVRGAGDGPEPFPAPGAARGRHAPLWGLFDSLVYESGDEDTLRRRAARLPPTLAGGLLETGPAVALLLEALEVAAADYTAGVWLEGEPLVRRRLAWWDAELAARLPALLAAAAGTLDLAGPCPRIPVILVPVMPAPGAATFRGADGPFVVTGVDGLAGADLAEVVLHEALHALEAAGGPGVPARLQEELQRRGADPFTVRQLPHALLFVVAAQAVRDLMEPTHQPVGRSRGAYDRGLGPYLGVLEPAVGRVAAGHLTPDGLLAMLADAFAPAATPEPDPAPAPGEEAGRPADTKPAAGL